MSSTTANYLTAIREYLTHATPAQRCIIGLLFNIPFNIAFILSQNAAIQMDRWQGSLNYNWTLSLSIFQGVMLCFHLGLIAWLWPRRFDLTPLPRVNRLVTTTITLVLAAEAGFLGNLTYSTNLVIIGIIPIGCLLLDIQSVAWAALLGVALIAFNDVMIFYDLMPYAPTQVATSVAAGALKFGPEMLRSGTLYTNFIAYAALFFILFDQYEYHRRCLYLTARRDSLTGLSNRRAFGRALQRACERSEKKSTAVSLALLDADFFKEVNDTYGHKVGDEVLVELANIIRQNMRDGSDLAARIGGEEFALLMTNTEIGGAQRLCERVREALRSHDFQAGPRRFSVTLSIGLVEASGLDAARLLQAADQNLYQAKNRGRNRVIASVGGVATQAAAPCDHDNSSSLMPDSTMGLSSDF